MRAEFVKQLERGSMFLASNLIKRETEKQKLTASEKDLEFSVSSPCLLEKSSTPSSRPNSSSEKNGNIPAQNRVVESLSRTVKSVEYSPQRPRVAGRRVVPPRRTVPNRTSTDANNISQAAQASQNEDVKKLAQLLLHGKMGDAGDLLKQRYTMSNIFSYEGDKDESGDPHGYGTMVFTNGDIYEGNFMLVFI